MVINYIPILPVCLPFPVILGAGLPGKGTFPDCVGRCKGTREIDLYSTTAKLIADVWMKGKGDGSKKGADPILL